MQNSAPGYTGSASIPFLPRREKSIRWIVLTERRDRRFHQEREHRHLDVFLLRVDLLAERFEVGHEGLVGEDPRDEGRQRPIVIGVGVGPAGVDLRLLLRLILLIVLSVSG